MFRTHITLNKSLLELGERTAVFFSFKNQNVRRRTWMILEIRINQDGDSLVVFLLFTCVNHFSQIMGVYLDKLENGNCDSYSFH